MPKDKDPFYLTKKEAQLIIFIREELPFGRCVLVSHGGQPQRVEDIKIMKCFGNGNKKSTGELDKNSC